MRDPEMRGDKPRNLYIPFEGDSELWTDGCHDNTPKLHEPTDFIEELIYFICEWTKRFKVASLPWWRLYLRIQVHTRNHLNA